MRVLVDSGAIVPSPAFLGSDWDTPTDCATTPTCTVTRADGTALDAATVTAANGDGVYTAALTATHTAQLDRLKLVWTGTAGSIVQVHTEYVDVVGGYIVSTAAIRTRLAEADDRAEANRYPLATVQRVRDSYERKVEEVCEVAFVPRFHIETISGTGTSRLWLGKNKPHELLSLTIDSTAATLSDYTFDGRYLLCEAGMFNRPTAGPNIVIGYGHGHLTPPDDLRQELLEAIVADLQSLTSTAPADVLSETFDGRTIRYSSPNPQQGRPTGIRDLDPILVRESYRTGIA